MDTNGWHSRPRNGSSKITAIIEIDGPEDGVLEDGTRLLRVIADLERSRLVTLRLEHGARDLPGQVVERGTDALDLVTTGADSPQEAALWRLVLRAGGRPATSDRGVVWPPDDPRVAPVTAG